MSRTNHRINALILSVICAYLGPDRAAAQISSTFQPVAASTDWFNPANWNNGIPNAPGDTARISTQSMTATLTSPVTVGQLVFLTSGSASVGGNQTLSFNNPGAEPALLQSQGATATLNVPISFASEQLRILASGPIELAGTIAASSGNIVKEGPNSLSIRGDNTNWAGTLSVNAGTVFVNHAKALGSTAGSTLINGGTLQVNQPIDEPITLSAGTLRTTVQHLDISGPLSIPAGNTAAIRGPFDVLGGAIGDGDLQMIAEGSAAITVSDTPLAHTGGLSLVSGVAQRQFAVFRADNAYRGFTSVNNVRLQVMTTNGLGTADAGTKVINGELWLPPGSKEDVELESGSTLFLWRNDATSPENRFDGQFTLRNSTLSTNQEFGPFPTYSVSKPIFLDGGSNTIAPQKSQLVLNGVKGHGDLLMNPDAGLFIAGPVENQGRFEIRGGPVHFTAPNVISGNVMVLNAGRLIADADQHVSRVMTGRRDESCCDQFGWIEASPGSTMEIENLDIFEGLLKGDIRTAQHVQLYGFGAARNIQNLVSGADVVLHAGQMELDDSDIRLGSTTGRMIVDRQSDTTILISNNPATIHADFYLNNATGFGYGGALRFKTNSSRFTQTVLAGDIHLGDRGASIGGEARARVEGQIFGGDLIVGAVKGAGPAIELVRAPAYTGKTSIRSGEVALMENGRLANTSHVEISTRARLAVDTLPSDGALSDRIADNLAIHMYGGELSVWPTAWGQQTTERVGRVVLKRGINVVRATHFFENSLQSHTELRIAELSRETGSILDLVSTDRRSGTPFTNEHSFPGVNDIVLENPPPVVNGILPAWLQTAGNFMTLDASGRVKIFQGPMPTFEDADETSIVRPPPGASSLDRDMTIHALYGAGNVGPVDLDGHTLTVGSGGVSGGQLSNGTVRPGDHSGGELIFVGSVVAANIVDNGRPTSVTYAGASTVSGENTYTGKTFVMSQPGSSVRITNGKALPEGGDIDITGWGSLFLQDRNEFHYKLGIVTIRDGGTFEGQCCDPLNYVTARKIEFESGFLSVTPEGNTPIVKTTDGVARIVTSAINSGFVGSVDVYDGLLIAGEQFNSYGYLALGQADVTVHPNGRLSLYSASYGLPVLPITITLNGGALYAGPHPQEPYPNLTGNIDVVADSKLYLFDGSAPELRQSDFRVTGRVNVAAGKTLEVLGRAYNRFGPQLEASDGIHLAPGAILAGDGAIRGRIEIADGAILSPGTISSGTSVGSFGLNGSIFVADPKSMMVFGKGGRYQWEINDAAGEPGAIFGEGWDTVLVRGELHINATADTPFVVELVGLDSIDAGPGIANLSYGQFRWQLVEAQAIVGFDPSKFVIDATRFFGDSLSASHPGGSSAARLRAAPTNTSFWVSREGNAIYINAALIPEPLSIVLLAVALVIGPSGRRRQRANGFEKSTSSTRIRDSICDTVAARSDRFSTWIWPIVPELHTIFIMAQPNAPTLGKFA